MKYLVIALVVAVAAVLAWKKFGSTPEPEPAAASSPNTTPGANVQNRIDTLSGAAPSE